MSSEKFRRICFAGRNYWLYDERMNTNAMTQAIVAAGSVQRLAAALGVSDQAVRKMRAKGRPPAGRCLAIERLTGVSRYELRPDIYGPAPIRRKRAA